MVAEKEKTEDKKIRKKQAKEKIAPTEAEKKKEKPVAAPVPHVPKEHKEAQPTEVVPSAAAPHPAQVAATSPAKPAAAPHATPSAEVAKEEAQKEPKKKKRAGKKHAPTKSIVARGKRKESVARVTITPGKGAILFNHSNILALTNPYIREIIVEPLRYIGPEANGIDISINVRGGGVMGQAQAARTAIANALSQYFGDMNLYDKFVDIDRTLVVEDIRRVESKKFRGPKARARFQKSYR